MKLLLTNSYAPSLHELIRREAPNEFDVVIPTNPTHAEIVHLAGEAEYLLVGGRIPIDAPIIHAATRLRMVQRTGVGVDGIDLDLLRARGIPLYVNRGVNAQSVAEHTLLLILASLRRLEALQQTLRAGRWEKHELGLRTRDLAGRRVGLVGLGRIGQAVARLLQPFDVEVGYSTPRRSLEAERAMPIRHMTLDALVAWSDVLSLHCPLTRETRLLMNAERLSLMRPGSILVNTARGALVDEVALLEALRGGRLGGAALDVFTEEPLPADHPLRSMENVVLTPHIGGITHDSFCSMLRHAFRNVAAFHAGDLDAIEAFRVA
jgi:phosphoglycerate dehydrogenase-like enzyme